MIEEISQLGIFLFGASAVWLSQDRRVSHQRWAPIIGLISQPFWLVSAFIAGQWGIMLICALYTVSWARGLRHHGWV